MPSARFAAQAIQENTSMIAADEDSDDDDVTLLNMPTIISLDDDDDKDEDEVLELTSQRKQRHSVDNDYEEGGEGDNDEDGEEDDEDEGPPSTKRRQVDQQSVGYHYNTLRFFQQVSSVDGDNEEGTVDADEDGEDNDTRADPAPAKKTRSTPQDPWAGEMKKPKSSRKPIPKVFTLKSDAPWTAMKTCLKPLIRAVFKPATLKLEEYNITFVVPRKDASTKENEEASPKAKKGKSTKICNERDILPANVALNTKIGALRERWLSPTPNGRCGSAHCFVHPDEINHFPLLHAHFDSWAAAMLKGDGFATIDKPPNDELFDKVNPRTLAACSPLLQ
ncbi:hypothetical protein B0H14DRAFT_3515095 [Mycena olivaceomarginata]|nr:hypothetical protein B0H14DRAFT_3515095 [Mycena olivaceomarginata]